MNKQLSMSLTRLKVKGRHCASCSVLIDKALKKVAGVQSVEANYGTETADIAFDETKTNPHELSKQIEPLGYSLVVPTRAHHEGQTAEEMQMNGGGSAGEHAAHTGIGQSKQDKLAEVADMRTKVLAA